MHATTRVHHPSRERGGVAGRGDHGHTTADQVSHQRRRHLFVEALLGAPRNTPVIRNDALQGWVSAHYTGGPHHWSRANVETIETTARRVRELIDRQVGG